MLFILKINILLSELRRVIAKYTAEPLILVPSNNEKTAYGNIKLEKISSLFDMIDMKDLVNKVESKDPTSMEAIGQVSDEMFKFF